MRSPIPCIARAAILLVATAACRAPSPSVAAPPMPAPIRTTYTSGEEVLAAMRARYDGKWYNTMTFTQKTSRLAANGTWNVQTWYEAAHLPGRLRIDFDPVGAGNGVLYARDSQFVVTNGRVLQRTADLNPLMLLGFDVHVAPTARIATLLRREGFDLTRVHPDTFGGRPMIVVGAAAGDMSRKQFWIDAERLCFVRQVEPSARDASRLQDVRFVGYEPRGQAWIAPRVELYLDGKLVFHEDYSDIRLDVPLDEALFDPAKWKSATHWRTP